MVDKWNGLVVKAETYFHKNLTRLDDYDYITFDRSNVYNGNIIKGVIKGIFIDKGQFIEGSNYLNKQCYILGYSSLDKHQRIYLYDIVRSEEYNSISKTRLPKEKSQEIRDKLKELIGTKTQSQPIDSLIEKISKLDIGEIQSISCYKDKESSKSDNKSIDFYIAKIDKNCYVTNLKKEIEGNHVTLDNIKECINDISEKLYIKVNPEKSIRNKVSFYKKIYNVFIEKNLFEIDVKYDKYNKRGDYYNLQEFLWNILVIHDNKLQGLNTLTYLKIISRYLSFTKNFECGYNKLNYSNTYNYRYYYIDKKNPELVFFGAKEVFFRTEKYYLMNDILITHEHLHNLYESKNIIALDLPLGFEEMYTPFIQMSESFIKGSHNFFNKNNNELYNLIEEIKNKTADFKIINSKIDKEIQNLNIRYRSDYDKVATLVCLGKILTETVSLDEISGTPKSRDKKYAKDMSLIDIYGVEKSFNISSKLLHVKIDDYSDKKVKYTDSFTERIYVDNKELNKYGINELGVVIYLWLRKNKYSIKKSKEILSNYFIGEKLNEISDISFKDVISNLKFELGLDIDSRYVNFTENISTIKIPDNVKIYNLENYLEN